MCVPIDLSQYELIREIDCNDFSTTYAARCVNNDKMISIQKVDLEKHPYSMAFLKGEMGFWSEMSYPNMMKYYGSFINQNILYIFAEYANQGNLLDIIHFQYPNGIKDELLIASILHEILLFLNSFHQSYLIHRSLETQNIFVGQNGSIQVGGILRARSLIQLGRLQNSRKSVIESSCYTAPELIIKDTDYHQSVDIWSLGIIAYELAIGKTPYSDYNPLYQVKSIISDPPPSLPNQKNLTDLSSNSNKKESHSKRSLSIDLSFGYNFSSAFHNFISLCLQKDPMKRPSAADLLKHKFISQAKGIDYIYSNMVIQLPQLSLRFSIQSNSNEKNRNENDNKNDDEDENKNKIDFNFCGFEDESESSSESCQDCVDDKSNDNINEQSSNNQDEKKESFGMHRFPSNDEINIQKFDLSNKRMVKSRSHSIICVPDNNPKKQVKVVKKGRFTLSIPIPKKNYVSVEDND